PRSSYRSAYETGVLATATALPLIVRDTEPSSLSVSTSLCVVVEPEFPDAGSSANVTGIEASPTQTPIATAAPGLIPERVRPRSLLLCADARCIARVRRSLARA